jgi:hypothetical protein
MSLINDALKKAQHQRTGLPGTGNPVDLPPMPGTALGAGGVKRGKPVPAQTLTLVIGSAMAAAVLAVVVTVYFFNREPAAPDRPGPRRPATPSVTTVSVPAPTPVIVATLIPKPAPRIDLSGQKLPAEGAVTIAVSAPTLAPVASPAAAPVVEAFRPAASGSGDIRILTYVDAVRVAGIRSSGSDSKVLMNDRVYRLNDVVDYTLGLRLTKVTADGLTFTDANGTTYVKNF